MGNRAGAVAVAAYTQRLRAAGGKRTSVDLTPTAVEDLADLQAVHPERSMSETICHALRVAANHARALATVKEVAK